MALGRNTFIISLLVITTCPAAALFFAYQSGHTGSAIPAKEGKIFSGKVDEARVTVIYDNNPYREGLETDWGFSCLVRGPEKTILFDTGGNSEIFLSNLAKLGINSGDVDTVVLSHYHGDHVGSVSAFLKKNPDVTLYPLQSFPASFRKKAASLGAKVVPVDKPEKICKGVFTTGEMGTWIKEQSLLVNTSKGLVIITGCAHPGIVKIISKARKSVNDDVLLVMGGFHLGSKSTVQINKIISSFKNMGVRHAGPCHCSGDRARKLFMEKYNKNYLNIGVGKVIKIDDLK